ncbi:MAG: nucleotidyltransferase domain-containing protein [Thermoproteota archaeon]|jgi:predicted nucleotidyltransferase|nr:nucleotidyltransferase domain-containing protein [Thermoproteota archaeon]
MGKAKSAINSQKIMLERAKRFVEKLKKELKLDEVYVIGSRARGDYLEDSDIDLVIICDELKGLRYIERLERISKYAEPKIEFFVYTKDEWQNSNSPYVIEMKKEAKSLEELLKAFD